jgi:hypothetical protein
MSQINMLYKLPHGLGYAGNGTCNPLQSQRHIQPQHAVMRSAPPQQLKAWSRERAAPPRGSNNNFTKYPVLETSCPQQCNKTAGIL